MAALEDDAPGAGPLYAAEELIGQNFSRLIPELDQDQRNGSLDYYTATDEARAIGLEREIKHKPAGLRTNMFICFGSAMFTILSFRYSANVADKTRIAAQIITGIGFIGAGSIMHAKGAVTGLTTAATMFVVASIGMAVGGGEFLSAIFATMVILVALSVLGWLENHFRNRSVVMSYEVVGKDLQKSMAEVNRVLAEQHHKMRGDTDGHGPRLPSGAI